MPKGVAKSGLRMTKQRLAAFEQTNPEIAEAYRAAQAHKNPLHLVQAHADKMAEKLIPAVRSDEEIEERLERRFKAMEIMTEATVKGMNRFLIVAGPAGVGKTHGIDEVVNTLPGNDYHVRRVSGFMRLTGMYRLFYENRHKGCTIIFDDSDSIVSDEDKLNLMKNATDTKEVRTLSWGAETMMETDNGQAIPREFVFEGTVIFITNTDMKGIVERGGRMAEHFEALISRSQYLTLGMRDNRDYLIRIKQVLRGGMLRDMGINPGLEHEIVDYMERNQDELLELSLRMVLKIAGLAKIRPAIWDSLADTMCLRED